MLFLVCAPLIPPAVVARVAPDMFESTYFNAVDEHAATPLGAMVIALLGLVLLGDAAARASLAAGRAIAGRS